MKKLTTIISRIIPLYMDNVDTDMIIPKQFLTTIEKKGLGQFLFFDLRFNEQGDEKEDCIFNFSSSQKAQILLSKNNFGCGSSREHAPWALLDYGIRVVIALSFADIFYQNCLKNSILPIAVSLNNLDYLFNLAKTNKEIKVDLNNKHIITKNKIIEIKINEFNLHCLLNGLDEIGLILEKVNKIQDFEKKHFVNNPWLY